MSAPPTIAGAKLFPTLRALAQQERALHAELDDLFLDIAIARPDDGCSRFARDCAAIREEDPDAYAQLYERSCRVAETAPRRIAELNAALADVSRARTKVRQPFIEARWRRDPRMQRFVRLGPSLFEKARRAVRQHVEELPIHVREFIDYLVERTVSACL